MTATLSFRDARVDVAVATDIGPRRKTNADAYLIDEPAGMVAIADGMGDILRSRAIAEAALEGVREMFEAPWALLPFAERTIGEAAERLWFGVQQANARLHVPKREGARQNLTTLVAAVFCARHFCLAYAGDSRAYLLRAGAQTLVKLTSDHTVFAQSVAGGMAPSDAAEMHDAHALTCAIGLRESLDSRPSVYPWIPGDTLCLCTDGVSDKLSSAEMGSALLEADTLEGAAHALVVRAIMAGGRDNATAVLARRLPD